MTTATVAKAATKVNALGNDALMKYRNMTDVRQVYPLYAHSLVIEDRERSAGTIQKNASILVSRTDKIGGNAYESV